MDVQAQVLQAVQWATGNAFNATASLMLGVFAIVFIASFVHDNYSWVDRSWSIVPVLYTWVIVGYTLAGRQTATASVSSALQSTPVVFALAITVWGVRLTHNFYRRGGYQRGGEDYRWNYVRTWPLMGNPVVWTAFNFFVISLYQTWLLWAITLPVLSLPAETATLRDWLVAVLVLVLVFFEALCDQQQWRFQNAKRQRSERQKDVALQYGFCVTGVFGYSRHLNVFCEGSIWVTLATAAWLRPGSTMALWQWAGCVSLVVLVHFSTGVITERLTKAKYPLYAVYQRTTPMLVPAYLSTTPLTLHLLQKASKKAGASD